MIQKARSAHPTLVAVTKPLPPSLTPWSPFDHHRFLAPVLPSHHPSHAAKEFTLVDNRELAATIESGCDQEEQSRL